MMLLRARPILTPRLARLSSTAIPTATDAVVVGGGVIGASTAYHLAKKGVRAVLIERSKYKALSFPLPFNDMIL